MEPDTKGYVRFVHLLLVTMLITVSLMVFIIFKLGVEIHAKEDQFVRISELHYKLSEEIKEVQIDNFNFNKIKKELAECKYLLRN